jgi:hypothetical protein
VDTAALQKDLRRWPKKQAPAGEQPKPVALTLF